MLLLAKFDLIPEKWDCKNNTLTANNINHVKTVFELLTKIVAFYLEVIIVEVELLGLENLIPSCKVCFAIYLALNTWFYSQLGCSLQVYMSIHNWRARNKNQSPSKSGSLSKSIGLSRSEGVSKNRGPSLKNRWRWSKGITFLYKNATDMLNFFNKSRVMANIYTGHHIWIDTLFKKYLSDFCFSFKRAAWSVRFWAFRIVISLIDIILLG